MTIDFTKYKSGHEAVASLIHQTIENRKEEDSDYSKKDFKELLNFKNENGRGSIYIYDVIDSSWGIGPQHVVEALAELGDVPIDVYINSIGGSVFDGRAIQSVLRRHTNEVVAYIDGACLSAATTIALAAERVNIAAGASYLVHFAWTFGGGNKDDFRKLASDLDKLDTAIMKDYIDKTGMSQEDIEALLREDRFMDAEEAVELGFCDEVIEDTSNTNDDDDKDNKEEPTNTLSPELTKIAMYQAYKNVLKK